MPPPGGTVANILLHFLQPSQVHGLSSGINRFCKKSSVYSQFKRVTDGPTDRLLRKAR